MTSDDALAWLLPRNVVPVRLLRSGSSAAALAPLGQALRPTWADQLVASDLPLGPADRAAILRADVPTGAVVCRQAALWVHAGAAPPTVLDVVLPSRHRDVGRVCVHGDLLARPDVVRRGGVAVTALGRTALDLARWSDERGVGEGLRLLVAAGLTRADVDGALTRARRAPRIARARRLLARVLPRDGDVTGLPAPDTAPEPAG